MFLADCYAKTFHIFQTFPVNYECPGTNPFATLGGCCRTQTSFTHLGPECIGGKLEGPLEAGTALCCLPDYYLVVQACVEKKKLCTQGSDMRIEIFFFFFLKKALFNFGFFLVVQSFQKWLHPLRRRALIFRVRSPSWLLTGIWTRGLLLGALTLNSGSW